MLKTNHGTMSHATNVTGVAAGLFIGSMIGAVTALLLAPQSGKRTRAQLQIKGIQLRDRTIDMAEDAVTQVRVESKKLTKTGRQKARQLIHQGQELVTGQFAHVAEVVKTSKKAILGS